MNSLDSKRNEGVEEDEGISNQLTLDYEQVKPPSCIFYKFNMTGD